ncbi:MAG: hypothetical protein M1822_002419 [Bathelium mastoideum]|nr:MAG: hypothetical protein M1822_002419 [Bathelium mastoideum]
MAWHPLLRQQYFNDWYYIYMNVALFATSMAFDIILLVFPIWPVLQLQTTARKKAEVAGLFMLGAAASVAAAYKLAIWTVEIHRYTHIDPVWLNYQMSTLIPPEFDTFGVTFWIPGQVEPTVALIGTSLPAFRQFLGQIKPTLAKVSKAISSPSSTPKGTALGSQTGGITVHRNFDVKQEYELRESNDSQIALHYNFE